MTGLVRSGRAGTLLVAVYGPTLLFAIGQGAVLPVIALSARDLGASVGVAGLVVALSGVGLIIGDLPAGSLADRLGERRAMIVSLFATGVGLAGCMFAPSVLVLGLSILLIGMASAVFSLARMTYLAEMLPPQVRGRGMSLLGGSYRIGLALGPFAGAWAAGPMGTDGAYLIHLLAAAATLALVWFLPELATSTDPAPPGGAPSPGPPSPDLTDLTELTLWTVLREHKRVLATTGVAALLVGAARSARITVIPLWCEYAGLDVAQTSLVVGVSGVVEIALFYPAGSLMDRVGRGVTGAAAMLLVAAGLAALPMTQSLWPIMVAASVVGLGNGLSSGLILTLGADVAPVQGKSLFFGGWRLISDIGVAIGPIAVGGIAAVASLAAACVAAAGLAMAAAGAVWSWAPSRPTA